MGIEPTEDPCEPYTGFEDQGHHQTPVTSALFGVLFLSGAIQGKDDYQSRGYYCISKHETVEFIITK
jgi:hypothetical protein